MLPHVPILEPITGVRESSERIGLGPVTILGVWGGAESPTSPRLRLGKRIFKENWGAVTQTQECMLGKTQLCLTEGN